MSTKTTVNIQQPPFSLADYELLFKAHVRHLRVVAFSMVKDVDAAKDIVQEFYVKFWEIQHKVVLDTGFEAYAVRAVKNRCLNYLEQKAVAARHELAYSDLHPEQDPTGINREDYYIKIAAAMAKMPEQRLKVFRLSTLEGFKYTEIAEQLDISVNTVKFHIKAAYAFLRQECLLLLITLLLSLPR
nr:RNA polymerase sigma-70 factor [Chitinophaga sp. Cy-1792]